MKILLCSLCFFLTGAVVASEPNTRSSLEGVVTSDLAAVLPGVTVGIDSLAGSLHRHTITNFSGYYLMDDVPPGGYTVWAEAKGYGCILYPHVAIFRGQRIRQDFHFARAKHLPTACEPVGKPTNQ